MGYDLAGEFLYEFIYRIISKENLKENSQENSVIKDNNKNTMLKPLVPKVNLVRVQRKNVPIMRQIKPIRRMQTNSSGFPKIELLIKDPAVTEIECQGEDQNILVRKGNSIQRTNITLSNEEIQNILQKFSKDTRIPIIGGTLKTALNNLIITAVISEILGPRFIIQKKNPFRKLIN